MIEPLGESQHSAKSLSLLRAKTAIGFDMSGAQIWSSRCILVELIWVVATNATPGSVCW